MHCIQALIAGMETLADMPRVVPSAVICPLAQGLGLVPITEAVEAELGASDHARPDPSVPPAAGMVAGVASLAATLSATGPVVYVATEFFGGDGVQDALVWRDGALVLQVGSKEDNAEPWPDSPISRALRHIGVTAFDESDEFDALGLGAHRDNDSWAQAQAPR